MADAASAHFEAVISIEPLSEPALKSSRLRRNLLALLVLPFDLLGSGSLWKPKVQHVVRIRRRDTHQTVASFEYLDGDAAAAHLSDLRARLQLEATADFCRSRGIAFLGR